MSILSAQSIRRTGGLISPFVERTVHAETGMTFGLGPCGYDIRVREDTEIDAGRMKLASAMEHIHLPANICATVNTKSSWARKGVNLPNTTIEPGWKGYLTLEIQYVGNYSGILIPAGSPIAEVRFQWLDEETEIPYAGKYQDQPPIPVGAIHEKVPE